MDGGKKNFGEKSQSWIGLRKEITRQEMGCYGNAKEGSLRVGIQAQKL